LRFTLVEMRGSCAEEGETADIRVDLARRSEDRVIASRTVAARRGHCFTLSARRLHTRVGQARTRDGHAGRRALFISRAAGR